MHQGDFDKVKGVYRINATDQVTHYQFAGCVECIWGRYPLPVLGRLPVSLPVVVLGFHSDTCFKYVNHRLVPLMQEPGLEEFATPLGWPSDNDALAGPRNGSVTRKRFGYGYILGRYVKRLDQSYCDILPLLLNHQSSCHLLLWRETPRVRSPTPTGRRRPLRLTGGCRR